MNRDPYFEWDPQDALNPDDVETINCDECETLMHMDERHKVGWMCLCQECTYAHHEKLRKEQNND